MQSITKELERRHKEKEVARRRLEEEKQAFFDEAIEFTKQLIQRKGWSTHDLVFTVVGFSIKSPRYATVAIRPKGYRCRKAVACCFRYSEAEDTSDMIDEIIEMLCDPDIFVPEQE